MLMLAPPGKWTLPTELNSEPVGVVSLKRCRV